MWRRCKRRWGMWEADNEGVGVKTSEPVEKIRSILDEDRHVSLKTISVKRKVWSWCKWTSAKFFQSFFFRGVHRDGQKGRLVSDSRWGGWLADGHQNCPSPSQTLLSGGVILETLRRWRRRWEGHLHFEWIPWAHHWVTALNQRILPRTLEFCTSLKLINICPIKTLKTSGIYAS